MASIFLGFLFFRNAGAKNRKTTQATASDPSAKGRITVVARIRLRLPEAMFPSPPNDPQLMGDPFHQVCNQTVQSHTRLAPAGLAPVEP